MSSNILFTEASVKQPTVGSGKPWVEITYWDADTSEYKTELAAWCLLEDVTLSRCPKDGTAVAKGIVSELSLEIKAIGKTHFMFKRVITATGAQRICFGVGKFKFENLERSIDPNEILESVYVFPHSLVFKTEKKCLLNPENQIKTL